MTPSPEHPSLWGRRRRPCTSSQLAVACFLLLARGGVAKVDGSAEDVAKTKHPVILVPGVHGCVFRVKLTEAFSAPSEICRGPREWLKPSPFNLLNPSFKDCQIAQLTPTFDRSESRWRNATGVELDWSVDFGGVDGISVLDHSARNATPWFKSMIDELVRIGYQPGKNLHGAPFDWRLAPDGWSQQGEFYDRLRTLIERTVLANRAPAHLVAHSLGSTAVLGFLAGMPPAWKHQHIASFVPITPNFGGAVTNVMTFVYGFDPGLPIPHDYMRALYTRLPSGAAQMPTPGAFLSDPPIVVSSRRNYTASDISALLDDLGHSQAGLAYRRLSARRQRSDQLPRPGVPVVLLTGSGFPTPRTVAFSGSLSPGHELKPSQVVYGDGDSVVNQESSLWAVKAWPGTRHEDFFGVDHYSALWNRRVLRALSKHILGYKRPVVYK